MRAILLGMACVLVAMAGVSSAQSGDALRPNIIWVMADDLGYGDLSCYGQRRFSTPNIDRMAAEGMRFLQHYAGSTVCAPSRSALMTGQHTGHTRVRGNSPRTPLRPEDVTVAEVLRGAGYATACIGKWGIGEPGTTGLPTRQGFDYFYGYLNQTNAHFYYPPFLWRNEERVILKGNDPETQVGQYSHDLITQEALDFVSRQDDKPFFLYLAYTIPHAELAAPEDSMAAFRGNFDPEPAHVDRHYGDQPTPRAAHAAMVSRMDRDVGRLLDLLRERGIAENTIVFFTSDNGPHKEGGHDPEFFDSNGPLRGLKRDLYEGGIRVPMIAWWPGKVAAGSVTEHVSAFWDFLPTCAELAGVESVAGVDGLSMAPTLLGEVERQAEHEYLYWEFYEQGGKQALRWGDWKGVRLDVRRDREGPIELYDLSEDLGESNDVASQHPRVVKRIEQMMREARTKSEAFSF